MDFEAGSRDVSMRIDPVRDRPRRPARDGARWPDLVEAGEGAIEPVVAGAGNWVSVPDRSVRKSLVAFGRLHVGECPARTAGLARPARDPQRRTSGARDLCEKRDRASRCPAPRFSPEIPVGSRGTRAFRRNLRQRVRACAPSTRGLVVAARPSRVPPQAIARLRHRVPARRSLPRSGHVVRRALLGGADHFRRTMAFPVAEKS